MKADAGDRLSPSTEYFFRAVVHVNNAEYMGDIERFTTAEETH